MTVQQLGSRGRKHRHCIHFAWGQSKALSFLMYSMGLRSGMQQHASCVSEIMRSCIYLVPASCICMHSLASSSVLTNYVHSLRLAGQSVLTKYMIRHAHISLLSIDPSSAGCALDLLFSTALHHARTHACFACPALDYLATFAVTS